MSHPNENEHLFNTYIIESLQSQSHTAVSFKQFPTQTWEGVGGSHGWIVVHVGSYSLADRSMRGRVCAPSQHHCSTYRLNPKGGSILPENPVNVRGRNACWGY